MKITVDIPEDALHHLINFTGSETKRAAIAQAVNAFNQRHRMAQLTQYAGTFKDFMGQKVLARMRGEAKKT